MSYSICLGNKSGNQECNEDLVPCGEAEEQDSFSTAVDQRKWNIYVSTYVCACTEYNIVMSMI